MKKAISLILSLIMVLSFSVAAFAAEGDFRPSVPSKDHPLIVPQLLNGISFDALILDENNEVIEGIHLVTGENSDGEIIVTAYSEIEIADERVNVVYMETSYKEVLGARSLQELHDMIPLGMIVRDFFDITLVGTYQDIFKEGKKLQIRFDIGAELKEKIMALTRCSDEEGWEFVESVTINPDGTVTVIFDKLCPVIFLTEKDGAVQSPATSDMSTVALWTLAIVFGMGSVCMIIASKKRARAK
ncbi:MAG: hypothetical protein IJB16_01000 [Clostridia bacterium]|nr:hypothetical protein [Clostridia bacterium]